VEILYPIKLTKLSNAV